MHTVDGGGKMEPKMLVEEDEVEEGSLGPKRWSKLVGDDEEEAPPTFCLLLLLLLFSMSCVMCIIVTTIKYQTFFVNLNEQNY